MRVCGVAYFYPTDADGSLYKTLQSVLVTTTLVIVLATIFIFGGGTAPLLEVVLAQDSPQSQQMSVMPVSKTNEIGTSLDMREARDRDGDGGQAWARRSSGFALFDKMWLIPIFRVNESERAGDCSRGIPTRLATDSDSPSASARGSKSPTWYSQHPNEHASDDD